MNATSTPILRREHTTLSSIDSSLLALILLPILVMIVYNRYYHPLSPFPGPFLASIWPGWQAWENPGNVEDQEPLLHERYGTIIRVSPNMISVADPECLKEICSRADRTQWWLPFGHKGIADGSSIRSSGLHEELRKRAGIAYSADVTRWWENVVDWRAREWIRELKGECGGGGIRLNFSEWARYLSVDLVSLVVFGVDIGCKGNERDNGGHIQAFERGLGMAGVLARLPNIYGALACNPLINNSWMAKVEKEGLGAVRVKVGLIIDAAWKSREEGTTKGVTLLEEAMSAKNSDGTRLTKEGVYSECFLPFLTAQDSTALAITSTLKLLLTNPRVLATLLSELATYYVGKPFSHIPPWTDIADLDTKLPYLSVVLRESLRLHPAFNMGILRIVSGVTLTHRERLYTIPGGCKIRANPFVIGRNKRVFGEDAHCFRPERWLDGSKEGVERMKAVRLEWGTGSSDCLGKALAQLAVAKAIVMVLRNFEIELASGHARGEMWKLVATGAHHAAELWVKVEPKEDKTDGKEVAGEMDEASEHS
ncbi:cytochrome P450 [Tuber magnatum]|uniref:Cytochrome P450 n=1 Tax=Tuber magnatum TaxID=42249 RepID=A0A317SRZ7_9PEZI|nr:cytochrome P450 [Tuber magnatum]